MATSFFDAENGSILHRPQERGYHMVYRDHETNRCPGCGRTHWLIGRLLAECAFCATALPLENAMLAGNQFRQSRRTNTFGNQLAA